jgi:hypothetical protein
VAGPGPFSKALAVKITSAFGVLDYQKFEITNHKCQTNHNDQSACGGPNLFSVLVIEYWNLKFVCNLVLGVWDFIIPRLQNSAALGKDNGNPFWGWLKAGSSGPGFFTFAGA